MREPKHKSQKEKEYVKSYFITKNGETIRFTIKEVKDLRRAVKGYYYHNKLPKDTLIEKLEKLGFAGNKLRLYVDRGISSKRKRREPCFICGKRGKVLHHKIFPATNETP